MNTFNIAGTSENAMQQDKHYAGPVTRGRRAAFGDRTNAGDAMGLGHAASRAVAPAAGLAGMRYSGAGMPAVRDIDASTATDPLYFTDYVNDMFEHYRQQEVAKAVNPSYMEAQRDINSRMRAILVDWLVEVHYKFRLEPETLYLTIALIDRFLERKGVVRQRLQLVGVTAMLMASKYEEIYAPEVRDFVYITDRAYTKEAILTMETTMLTALDFNITQPTALHFLKRFLQIVPGCDERMQLTAKYLLERCLQEFSMLNYLPSMQAAACLNATMRSLGRGMWDATFEKYTGYSEAQLRPAVTTLETFMARAESSSLQAVRKKYHSARFGEVASMTVVPMP